MADLAFVGIESGLGSQNTQNASWPITVPAGTDLVSLGIETYVNGSDVVTSVTIGGVAATRVPSGYVANPAGYAAYMYQLLGPPTGSQTLAISISGGVNRTIVAIPAFYSSAEQSGQPDAGGLTQTANGPGSISRSITTVADRAWAIAFISNDTAVQTPSSGTTARMTGDSRGIYDSGGPITPSGTSKTLGAQIASGGAKWAMIIATYKPSTAVAAVETATVVPSPGPAFSGGAGLAF